MNSRRLFTEISERQEKGSNKSMEVRAFVHKFSHPDERKEYIEMLQLGSKFDMRPRAIFYFYGADLIAYKRKHLSSPQVNEFLRILSTFLTTQLEDDCPGSWEECGPEFWEELIITCFPQYMKISIKQKETKTFLIQLKRFAHWVDERIGCSCYEIVEKYVEENMSELKISEEVLNELHLDSFPKLHDKDWNPREDCDRISEKLKEFSSTVNSIFEVSKISGTIISLYDIDTTRTYQIINFPTKIQSRGILIDGVIGKAPEDIYWNLCFAEAVYPKKAQKYIQFVD